MNVIDAQTAKFLKFFAKAYPSRTVVAIGLLGVAGLLEGVGVATLIPLLRTMEGGTTPDDRLSQLVDQLFGLVGLEPTLVPLLLFMFVSVLLKAGMVWMAMMQVGGTVIDVVQDLRLRLLRSLMQARWSYFSSARGGEWANAVGHETSQAGMAYLEACMIGASVFPIAAYVALATVISWQTSVAALVAGGMIFYALRWFVSVSRRAGHEGAKALRVLTSLTADVLQGFKPLKAMAHEDLLEPVFHSRVQHVVAAGRKSLSAREGLKFFHEPSVALLMGGAIFVVFEFSSLPLSGVVVLAFTFYRILTHLNTAQMRYTLMMQGEATFWSLMERIEGAEHARERFRSADRLAPTFREGVHFETVSFGYDGVPVLRDLDVDVERGEFIAISGESGSGKTTFVDLLVGLHTPVSGRILIDGVDLQTIDLRAWRKRIGYVPQEMLMLNDSIRANVTLGDESLTDEDVERALRLAGAWDFVMAKPDGIETEMGERGTMLSGGQRQRIAIARALVGKPWLLILDEVTTALDPDTEAEICDTLRSLAGEATIVAISHQPAMQDVADKSYVMREGRFVLEATLPA